MEALSVRRQHGGVVSAEKGQATEAMDGVCRVMEGQKLMMHERGLFEDEGEVFGVLLDPKKMEAAHREETVET